ncbi:MAG: hypothetical protein AAB864_01595 [Patescibacteria group bacterium]
MHNQRGSIIIFSLMILTVTLTMALALVNVLIPKLRLANVATNAAVALYAADSGSELCLYEARQLGAGDSPLTRPIMANGSDFVIVRLPAEQVITNNCIVLGSASFTFRATGRFSGTSRALEVSQ